MSTNEEATMAIRIRRLPAVAALALAAVVALVALVLVRDDDATQVHGGDTTTTTAATSTTTTEPTTTTTAPAVDTATAVWPWAASEVRYDDPVEAARGFAEDYVGFTDPVVGSFQAGDSRSGEVEVRGDATGAVTTVFVRQLGPDGTWWVLGSASENIVVNEPAAGVAITSPVHVAGMSRAFEAQVDVAVRQDGSTEPLGTGYVMGSGGSDLGPFEDDELFGAPTAEHGALVFTTTSARDGRVWEASVLRVRFADVADARMTVSVWFTDQETSELVAVERDVPATTGVLRVALEQLLLGPTDWEEVDGLTSWFSADTAGMLRSVDIDAGRATVDFADLRPVIPNASASAGSALLLSQLDATVFQFPTVTSVEYRIEGSCDDFFEWLQLGCEVRTR